MTLVDDTLVQNILQMDASNTRLIECGKIVYSDSIIRIEHRGVKQGNDDNDVKIVTVGHCVLDKGELITKSDLFQWELFVLKQLNVLVILKHAKIYLDIHVHELDIEFSPIVKAQAEYGERKLIINQANFFVGISSSILVLLGGVEFVQYQKEFSNTVIHVDTGHCIAAVQVAADEDPLTFTLRTWFEERLYIHTLGVYHVEQLAHKYVLLDEKVQRQIY
ncbi:MAG: hypothetical protein EZS28_015628 [Streblomastix strix]|uniref:Uncharacterized protein n=1 Tax=Streblomastix strix TaxID=222440 RepID=A0A5J4W1K3_9EUKA|nr:MAG: hypothetical protein EZS28_015628 [Streblomastix strix]